MTRSWHRTFGGTGPHILEDLIAALKIININFFERSKTMDIDINESTIEEIFAIARTIVEKCPEIFGRYLDFKKLEEIGMKIVREEFSRIKKNMDIDKKTIEKIYRVVRDLIISNQDIFMGYIEFKKFKVTMGRIIRDELSGIEEERYWIEHPAQER